MNFGELLIGIFIGLVSGVLVLLWYGPLYTMLLCRISTFLIASARLQGRTENRFTE